MLISHYLENELSASESSVMKLVFHYPNECVQMSISQLAERAYVSKTTIVRVVKKLGLKNFEAFKEEIGREADYILRGHRRIDANMPFLRHQAEGEVVDNIALLYRQTIDDTAQLLQQAELRRAAKLIRRAHHIYTLGAYGGSILSNMFTLDMRLIGRYVRHLSLNVPCVEGTIGKNDVVIVLSYQDLKDEECRVLSYLKKSGTKIIVISSLGLNHLKQWADVFLPVCSYERRYEKIKAYSSQLSMMMVLNILYSFYFQQDYDQNLKNRAINAQKIFY